MATTYREKLFKEIESVPEAMLPQFYRIIHLLRKELLPLQEHHGIRGSLKGIWKGGEVNDSLFTEARESMFPYEAKEKP